jgi:hypothetical protein
MARDMAKASARHRQYYLDHRDRILQASRQRYEANRAAICERQREPNRLRMRKAATARGAGRVGGFRVIGAPSYLRALRHRWTARAVTGDPNAEHCYMCGEWVRSTDWVEFPFVKRYDAHRECWLYDNRRRKDRVPGPATWPVPEWRAMAIADRIARAVRRDAARKAKQAINQRKRRVAYHQGRQ